MLFVRNHPLTAYFVLSYLISWTVALPLIGDAQGWWQAMFPPWVHYLTAYGPLLSALIVVSRTDGAEAFRIYVASLFRCRGIPWWAWLVAVSPLILFALCALGLSLIGERALDYGQIGLVNFLPDLGLGALALWVVTSGFGEEAGWRGFALPRLLKRMNPFFASVLLAAAWAGWHLPAFYYLPTYMNMSLYAIPGFLVGILSGSIVLTWLYGNSHGSASTAILWHGTFNFVTAAKISEGLPAAIISTAVIAWAVLLVVAYRRGWSLWQGQGNEARQK